MTSSTIISIKQYYCNKQLLDPPAKKKNLCFAVEIKDGFISHYNSLKKKNTGTI